MHAYRYKTNFLVDLGRGIMYEVLILSEPFLTHLNLCLSISPFTVAISTLAEFLCQQT